MKAEIEKAESQRLALSIPPFLFLLSAFQIPAFPLIYWF